MRRRLALAIAALSVQAFGAAASDVPHASPGATHAPEAAVHAPEAPAAAEGGNAAPAAENQDQLDPSLPIYKMVRSLEDVQDKIVGGDVGASEMQRFVLGVIDRRLRTAQPEEFNELRNVDAAMIYAMSGGNPATLDFLIAHDSHGNFDTRITNALLMYMGGKAGAVDKTLEEVVPEYKSTSIGPYLALIAGNALTQKKPEKALEYFDWARLILPGTIVEEAALRRSLLITVRQNNVARSLDLARLYFSRFPKSPYAAQSADQVVALIDAHEKDIGNERISELLGWLDDPRQQELYLRVARKAAIGGRFEFAHWAAGQALALSKGRNDSPAKLAELYLGLSSLRSADIAEAKSVFSQIPDEMLGPKERRLRDAGAYILKEVEKPPTMESLTQAHDATVDKVAKPSAPGPQGSPQPLAGQTAAQAGVPAKDATKDGIDTFLSQGHDQLKAIDEMMRKGSM